MMISAEEMAMVSSQFLRELHEMVEWDSTKVISSSNIGKQLDLDNSLTWNISHCLKSEGLIEITDTARAGKECLIKITRDGIHRAQEASSEPARSISHLANASTPSTLPSGESQLWCMIHKDVVRVAKDRFEDGHYADSVVSAFKEMNARVRDIVKNKTGRELDGASLMTTAFSANNPIILLDGDHLKLWTRISLEDLVGDGRVLSSWCASTSYI